MKILTLHCDHIKWKPIKKAIKEPEDIVDKNEKEAKECLVVFTAVEKGDNDDTISEMLQSVKKTASDVKTKSIVIYPYAHLSSNLADPNTALEYLRIAEDTLKKMNYTVSRAPFGYYKSFELKVKGHPLSELSKSFSRIEEIKAVPESIKKHESENDDPSSILKEISRHQLDTSKLKENDHRILAQKLDLFSFSDSSPGSVFWHKNGQAIFNELIKFSREIHNEDYQEISTPQILDSRLWKISGHWNHYKDNMFIAEYESKSFGVKPMNCPGMMLIYKTKTRSYRDLPLRLFEFGTVHRKELSGVLSGLFRVVRFTQDDAHIFSQKENIGEEISKILNLIHKVYKETFNFEYSLELSTRPEKFMGEITDWDYAESELEKSLRKSKAKFKINKGDGAFYGPKIDVHIKDSLGRSWQCATIQLDMQMPKRFEINYIGKDNKLHTPIVIHRAIFGSIERFIGILLEHLNGNMPLWLSPIQARIISFTDRNEKAAEKALRDIKGEIPNIRIDSDLRNTTVNDKVRDAELMKIPYIIVIGDKEEQNKTLAVRERGSKPKFGVNQNDLINELKNRINNRV